MFIMLHIPAVAVPAKNKISVMYRKSGFNLNKL